MSLEAAARRLSGVAGGTLRLGEPMSRHTSFRVGGPAALFIECDSLSHLHQTMDVLAEADVDWLVLGKGSNVLVADEGYPGAVIVLGKDFKHFAAEENELRTGAGVLLARLVQSAFSTGLSGLEFAVGIPGTVGGALVMNAGSREVWFDGIVRSVTVLEPGGGLRSMRRSEVAWAYRRTDLARRGVVVEATLLLDEGDRDKIRWEMERSLSRRRRTQPLSLPSAGSVFKNPANDSAGRLIEAAGLKGTRIGGAQVSEVHANFIVNAGGARANDVLSLVELIQGRVRDLSGVELQPEIQFLGAFDEP